MGTPRLLSSVFYALCKWSPSVMWAARSSSISILNKLVAGNADVWARTGSSGNRECYVGMLYACYDLIRPDLILELSWRNGLNDFTMPYMINLLCQQTKELASLKADNEVRKVRKIARLFLVGRVWQSAYTGSF